MNMPEEYFWSPYEYEFPKVDDFKSLVLSASKSCFIRKKDLSQYYLQIPLDLLDYPYMWRVWRRKLYFFVALMFGLKHSGLKGQRLTDAVAWIHQRLGFETSEQRIFISLNYFEHIGSCERELNRATESFDTLGLLLKELILIKDEI